MGGGDYKCTKNDYKDPYESIEFYGILGPVCSSISSCRCAARISEQERYTIHLFKLLPIMSHSQQNHIVAIFCIFDTQEQITPN